MNILLVLYLIYLSWGTVGQGRVSFLEMSRYLRKSKSQTKTDMLKLAEDGLLDVTMLFSPAGARKYFVSMTSAGDDFLMLNFDAAIDAYHQHVAETVLVLQAKMKERPYETHKRLSKRERDAAVNGQLNMFEEG